MPNNSLWNCRARRSAGGLHNTDDTHACSDRAGNEIVGVSVWHGMDRCSFSAVLWLFARLIKEGVIRGFGGSYRMFDAGISFSTIAEILQENDPQTWTLTLFATAIKHCYRANSLQSFETYNNFLPLKGGLMSEFWVWREFR